MSILSQTFFPSERALTSEAWAAKPQDHHLVVKGYCNLWFLSVSIHDSGIKHCGTWRTRCHSGSNMIFFSDLEMRVHNNNTFSPLLVLWVLPGLGSGKFCFSCSCVGREGVKRGERKKLAFLNCDYPLQNKYWQYILYFT